MRFNKVSVSLLLALGLSCAVPAASQAVPTTYPSGVTFYNPEKAYNGYTVIGYGTKELPAFYTRKSGFKVDYRLDTPKQLAEAFHVKRELGLEGGMLVTNPIPEQYSMDADVINKAINEAVEIAKKYGQESSGGFVNAILAKIMKSGE